MEDRWQPLFYFSVAVLLAIILLWAGSKLLFSPGSIISDSWLLLIGIALVLGGVFMVGANIADFRVIGLFIIVGFYFCLRAAGILDFELLSRVVGLVCIIEAVLGVYLAWPGRHKL